MKSHFRLLLIAQLPPPVHGSATISKIICESSVMHSTFNMRILPLHFSKSMKDLGTLSFGKMIKMLGFALKIMSVIRHFKPDLVYFTLSPKGLSFYRDVVYVVILKLFGSRIVYHLHVKGVKKESKRNLFKRILYKFVFKNTDIITLSRYLVDDVAAVYSKSPYVVNNGVYAVSEKSSLIINKKKHPGNITLLYLSNLVRTKGIFVFLEAVLWLSKKYGNLSARIVGNPADISREEVQAYILENNLTNTIVVDHALYDEEKYEAFKTADIFIHPTLNDAFPLVILEAMQFALPVISTFEGAIAEIVTDGITGYLVPKNDPLALAQKAEELICNPEKRIQMGKAGKEKFLTHYTADKLEKNLRDVLLAILTKKHFSKKTG